MNEEYLLEAKSIKKSFSGVPALRNGSLKLRRGSVHALCGGNGAGKSTFLNILMGLLQRDAGDIYIEGKPVHFSGPSDALDAGISIISQELEPVPGMTVAENLYLGREPKISGFIVNYRKMFGDAEQLLQDLHFDISPRTLMSKLSLAQIQLVEIAKAISYNSKIIIMDEPTSAIGEKEAELLFSSIRRLQTRGTSIIYVSHRMNELYQIADEYTIFRDGQFIESGEMTEIDRRTLINNILGAELEEEFTKFNTPNENILLEVNGFTRKPVFEDISLRLYDGEILGIFGLMGAGRSEFLETLFGTFELDEGYASVKGTPFVPVSPKAAMQAGMALVTEDRKGSGLVLEGSVKDNISLASLHSVSRLGVVQRTKEVASVDRLVTQFSVKAASRELAVKHMSGGNQQKVVLAKWMKTEPCILLLDEPTRGVDVGAKREIYHFMSEFARDGKAIIMVSSEIPEVLGMCDRVIVFRRGKMTGELKGDGLTQENLAKLAS
ncbi:D-xylose ABC transporter ATP-binding protein [Zobellella endophytica]|uniref:D-xylose ABC transporter ATP-binding protein n=1 Tax=Zobellella endophytica TaxID=2116700 RepID=A0A2P7R568_9GAMM|nr:sugar ABC transporter ATP-binding protein [Zobellella endophytica]PSJ45361.1 D-xylose ABC transporter ATP-binding protein [Zobellella endophytica]